MSKRISQIPILHIRGTNYEVGYAIGRTFKSQIHDLFSKWVYLSEVALVKYGQGQETYDVALKVVTERYPQYVEEIRGTAEGAEIPFEKLFVLHVDAFISDFTPTIPPSTGEKGCTAIMINGSDENEIILAHNEDCTFEMVNNIYFVNAEILNENGEMVEKWSSLTYAGHLSGFTMGWNPFGMVQSFNQLVANKIYTEGTPRIFIARALLTAKSIEEAEMIVRDKGVGIADGFSINMFFLGSSLDMYNIEVGPGSQNQKESSVDTLAIKPGQFYGHCNKYLRLKVPEPYFPSSVHRHKVLDSYGKITSVETVKKVLSDESDKDYPIFRNQPDKEARTAIIGIFRLSQNKEGHWGNWELYTDKATMTQPAAVIPLISDSL